MKPVVLGPTVDEQTRCVHYRTPLDIIAIRFACCGQYYPCHLCHDQTADHPSRPWPAGAGDERAVLCGVCWTELTVAEYRGAGRCPACAAAFNPRCALHSSIYFGQHAQAGAQVGNHGDFLASDLTESSP